MKQSLPAGTISEDGLSILVKVEDFVVSMDKRRRSDNLQDGEKQLKCDITDTIVHAGVGGRYFTGAE